ncbi:MAG TPA: pyridoxamine 5'-phosphate oxidase family protein [Bacteroidales bacterium]|nr:pyridoxamine 5'-phosphate oxidase family protein [Bacteroidales bacterium]
MKKSLLTIIIVLVFSLFTATSFSQAGFNKDTLMIAAREIMTQTTYCGLVTVDKSGQPQVRTMNPFPLKDEFVVWFATSRSSRKVKEINENPRVCVYYADHVAAKGYVNITGNAQVIDDKELLLKMKRDYWEGIPNWQNNFVLIKIIPATLEVINYKHNLNNDPVTFRAPSVVL